VGTAKGVGAWITTVLGLVSVCVGIILGVRQLIPAAKASPSSAVFVLDVSPAMQSRLGQAEADIRLALSELTGVPTSLRLVSGCGANANTGPTLKFVANRDNYEKVFSDVAAQARSTASYDLAVNGAVNDLNQRAESTQKLLYVFTADSCPPSQLDLSGNGVTVTFVWLGAPGAAGAAALERFKNLHFDVVHASAN